MVDNDFLYGKMDENIENITEILKMGFENPSFIENNCPHLLKIEKTYLPSASNLPQPATTCHAYEILYSLLFLLSYLFESEIERIYRI